MVFGLELPLSDRFKKVLVLDSKMDDGAGSDDDEELEDASSKEGFDQEAASDLKQTFELFMLGDALDCMKSDVSFSDFSDGSAESALPISADSLDFGPCD